MKIEPPDGLDLPRYQSHKVVMASKILEIIDPTMSNQETDGRRDLILEDGIVTVGADYMRKHDPREGGYFVVYPDGYCSWSPAEAFKSGYSRID